MERNKSYYRTNEKLYDRERIATGIKRKRKKNPFAAIARVLITNRDKYKLCVCSCVFVVHTRYMYLVNKK